MYKTAIHFYLALGTRFWDLLACNKYSLINSIKMTFYSTTIIKEDNFKQSEYNKDRFRKETHQPLREINLNSSDQIKI